MTENPNADETPVQAEKATLNLAWMVGPALVLIALTIWFFLSTGEPSILIFAVLLLPYLFMLPWTVSDARRKGLPVAPWFLVVLLLNVLGFVVYLVVREWDALRAR